VFNTHAQFKSGSEIACLQVASDVSSDAHRAVIRAARGTSFEYQLQSVFLNTTVGAGLKHVGYPAIIGAGRNSAILHYDRNNGPIQPHDVVLMDAGSEYRCYTADITRYGYTRKQSHHSLLVSLHVEHSWRLFPKGKAA
jgi:Xaa-Pro dipeptidase